MAIGRSRQLGGKSFTLNTKPRIDVTVNVTSPFTLRGVAGVTGLPHKKIKRRISDVRGPRSKVSTDRFNSALATRFARRIRNVIAADAKSVQQRALGKARGTDTGRGVLRIHKPLGNPGGVKTSIAGQSDIRKSLLKSLDGAAPYAQTWFRVWWEPSNRLVAHIGWVMEGDPQGEIHQASYAKVIVPKTLVPRKAKNFLIPNLNARHGVAPTSMMADLSYAAAESSDPRKRYLRLHNRSGVARLTDLAPVGGFRFKLFGGTGRMKHLPKGIYIVPERRRGAEANTLILAYFLKPKVRIRGKAWFTLAFNEWFRGIGGTRNYARMSREIGKEFEHALRGAFGQVQRREKV